jgi:hypothetical protein
LEWFGTTPIVNYDNDVSMHVIDPNRRLVQIDGVTCYHPFELLYQKRTLINSPSRKPEKREQDQIDLRKLITLVNNYE